MGRETFCIPCVTIFLLMPTFVRFTSRCSIDIVYRLRPGGGVHLSLYNIIRPSFFSSAANIVHLCSLPHVLVHLIWICWSTSPCTRRFTFTVLQVFASQILRIAHQSIYDPQFYGF